MLLQMLFFSFMLAIMGTFLCLAVWLDPNVTPNPARQRLLPIGLGMLFGGGGSLCYLFGLGYIGNKMESSFASFGGTYLLGILFLGGYGAGVVCGAIVGFRLGRIRNKRQGY
jgi:hypothetical protein